MMQENKVPPVSMTLHGEGGARVEITVEAGHIWLSDWSKDRCNFTLKIAREPLLGNDAAVGYLRARGDEARKKLGNAVRDRSGPHREMDCLEAVTKSGKAGYWYVDPRYSMHGTPVTVIEG